MRSHLSILDFRAYAIGVLFRNFPPVTMSSRVFQKQYTDSTQYPSKSQLSSSQSQKEQFSNSSGIAKNPGQLKTILNNKRTSGGISIPGLKQYYRAIVLKTAWYWYNVRQADQWNRIEDPEMNPHTYGHLTLDKGAKNIQ